MEGQWGQVVRVCAPWVLLLLVPGVAVSQFIEGKGTSVPKRLSARVSQTMEQTQFAEPSEPPVKSETDGLEEPPLKPGGGPAKSAEPRPLAPEPQVDLPDPALPPMDDLSMTEADSVFASDLEPAASPFLHFGQLSVGYGWSYSDTDHIYFGEERLRDAERAAQVEAINNTHTVSFELGLCDRWSLVYELPFQVNSRSQQTGPLSGGRISGLFVTDTGDVADSRLILRRWLLDQGECLPLLNRPGNVSLGIGVKLPTGREDKSTFFNGGDGGHEYFHDVSVQTGTGSTDLFLSGAMYLEYGYLVPFAGFNWTIAPQEDNDVLAFHPQIADPNTTIVNSVTDSISWTVGFRYELGQALASGQWLEPTCCGSSEPVQRMVYDPCTGCPREPFFSLERLRFTFSLDGSHVPENDIFGGSSGFRRAFDALFVTPGLHYELAANCSVFASVPFTVYRNLTTEAGTFPHTQLLFGASFNVR